MELYWLLRLPALHNVFVFAILVSVIWGIINLITIGITSKQLITLAVVVVILDLFAAFVPNDKQLAIMLGWDAINSNSVQEVIEILKEKIK